MMTCVSTTEEVGRNIRRLRGAAGLSLADLAQAAEVSKTTLHGIEQGTANPTLSTLYSLAAALRVPLGELLEPPAIQVTVVRAEDGARVTGDAVQARLMHRMNVSGQVELYELRVDRAEQRSRGHLPGVEECLVVTHGEISCGPADRPVKLRPGDSARYDASVAHVYQGVAADNRAYLLMIHP
jgi:transcriptional regulator with XRE-family HTH domain